jgi:hypothetical protein
VNKWDYGGCFATIFNGLGLAYAIEDYVTHGIRFRNIGFIIGCFKITFYWTKE